jgi:FkbM family methyltransferase
MMRTGDNLQSASGCSDHNRALLPSPRSEYVGSSILQSSTPFQAHVLAQLMEFITPGSTVVDAGANMGSFSMFFAAATGPTGAVYSFEPQTRMYEVLCTNKVVNDLLQLHPRKAALSFAAGTLAMSDTVAHGESFGESYAKVDQAGDLLNYGGMRLGRGGESVAAITLDSLGLENVSVIKVDVQGSERLMFYGARDTIRRNLPVVAFEVLEDDLAESVSSELAIPKEVAAFDIVAFLKGLGYAMPEVCHSILPLTFCCVL